MQNIWPVFLPIGEVVAMVLAARVLLHYFQLESYQFHGYFKTIGRQWKRAFLPGIALNAAFAICILCFSSYLMADSVFYLPIAAVQILLGVWLYRRAVKTPQKKKFALTARMKRLYAAFTLVCLAAVWLNIKGLNASGHWERANESWGLTALILFCIRPSLFLPLLVALLHSFFGMRFGGYFRSARLRM